jgi:hypothetical protein
VVYQAPAIMASVVEIAIIAVLAFVAVSHHSSLLPCTRTHALSATLAAHFSSAPLAKTSQVACFLL